MEPVSVKLGEWVEVVTDQDHILVGRVSGYRIAPVEGQVGHTLYLDGVSEHGTMAVELSSIRRMRTIHELHLHVNVHAQRQTG